MKKLRELLDLKPTQFAVGMLEVDEKIKVVGALGRRARKAFVKGTPVEAGLRDLYVVDHHHCVCVCVGSDRVRMPVR
jgi:hypothetical protein